MVKIIIVYHIIVVTIHLFVRNDDRSKLGTLPSITVVSTSGVLMRLSDRQHQRSRMQIFRSHYFRVRLCNDTKIV